MNPALKRVLSRAMTFFGTPSDAVAYDEFALSRALYDAIRGEMATGLRPDQAIEAIRGGFVESFARDYPGQEFPWTLGGIASEHTLSLPGGSPTEDGRYWIQVARVERDRTDFAEGFRVQHDWLEQFVLSYHPDFRMAQVIKTDGVRPAHESLGPPLADIEGVSSDGATLWALVRSRNGLLEEATAGEGYLQMSIAWGRDEAAVPPGDYIRHIALLGGVEVPGIPALTRLDYQIDGEAERDASDVTTWELRQTMPSQSLEKTMKKDELDTVVEDDAVTDPPAANDPPAADDDTGADAAEPDADDDLEDEEIVDLCADEDDDPADEKAARAARAKRRRSVARLLERHVGTLEALVSRVAAIEERQTRSLKKAKEEAIRGQVAALGSRVAPLEVEEEIQELLALPEDLRNARLERLKKRTPRYADINQTSERVASLPVSGVPAHLRMAAHRGDQRAVTVAEIAASVGDTTSPEGRAAFIQSLREAKQAMGGNR